jgi:glycosyl transferase family 25
MNRNLFAKRFETYVISLERTPHRLKQFREWNEAADIDIEVFKAIDGRQLDMTRIDASIVDPEVFADRPGSIGSATSHHTLWSRCAAGQRPFLIFEDDTAVRADIRTKLPPLVDGLDKDWDLFCIGYNTDTLIEIDVGANIHLRYGFPQKNLSAETLTDFTTTTGDVCARRLTNFFGLCAYMLSPRGAQRLLELVFPLHGRPIHIQSLGRRLRTRAVDVRTNAHLGQVKAYACIPPLAIPSNDIALSTKVAEPDVSAETATAPSQPDSDTDSP